MNTVEFLRLSSEIVPDRTAIIFEDKRIDFSTLQQRVNKLADSLSKLGVVPGDRVSTIQVNCNEHIEAYFAITSLDAIYVPVNFRVRSEELEVMLSDSKPKVIFAGSRYHELVKEATKNNNDAKLFVSMDDESQGWINYDDLIRDGESEDRFPEYDDDDTNIIMYTSGTTGSPKGVMLKHDSFSSYILANVMPADPDEEEKNILTVPLHHIAGMQAVISAIYGGRTLVIQRQFEPYDWMRLVQDEQINRAMMVPTMLKAILDHKEFSNFDISSLGVITYGAAPMPASVIKDAIAKLPGTRFINAFGQTETASTITMLSPEDHEITGTPEEQELKLKRLSSIGKPLDDVIVQIVDEEGKEVIQGDVGEIVAQGPRLMKGYWNKVDATNETIRDGWLYTGDLGYMDSEGYIFLSGRAKDFIKRGGEMIAPDEVENVILTHSSIDDAAVIGVNDEYWGERVRAVVVLKSGMSVDQQEIIDYCHERLASYKKPESVIFAQEIPKNPMGKILKRELRDMYPEPIE